MSEHMKLRRLPDGEFQDVAQAGLEKNMLRLNLLGEQAGLSNGDPAPGVLAPGVLVEVQSESTLYLGEVRQRGGSAITVFVEHSLDRARLASIQDTWG